MNVLVVALHPDDETIGCGGTLLKHKAEGDDIYWLIITNVDENFGWSKSKVLKRQEEIKKVSKMFGFKQTFKLDYPTAMLDKVPMNDLIKDVSNVFNKIKPNIVYLPNRSDVHTDHQIGFQASYSCTKSFRSPFIKRILMYEALSETEFAPAVVENAFVPNYFVDITNFISKKKEIMSIYESEVMDSPFPRSHKVMEALATLRGSRIGKKFAESFMLLQEIK